MSMGSSGAAEGGAGMSLAGGFGAEGSSPLAGSGESGGGGGIMELLGGLLKDPQTLKSISKLGSTIGSTVEAGNNLSPHVKQMLTQAIQQGSRPKRPTNPFVGDMVNYISPDVAANTLRSLGIPTGRMGM